MFVLGDQEVGRDEKYCARLDMDTRVRRRLYETMVRKRCGRVRTLDGLPLTSKAESAGGDVVWAAMAEKGLVKATEMHGEGKQVMEGRSGRWPAEDSFA